MDLLGDIRLSARTLIQNPGFTAVAVTMLAVGIGVNATVFTVTNAVLFKGFRMVPKATIASVYISDKNSNCCVSYPDFEDWTEPRRSRSRGWRLSTAWESSSSMATAFPRISKATKTAPVPSGWLGRADSGAGFYGVR